MNGVVVVDASLAFKWLVEEEYSDLATALVENVRWIGEFTAPPNAAS